MKVFLDMVGCRLNQSEIEAYASQLRQAGHEIIPTAEDADLVIINTCTVTAAAAADSRQKVRSASRMGAHQIVVTGCHATLYPTETASLPGVTRVIDNDRKDQLVPLVLDLEDDGIIKDTRRRESVAGPRMRTRAFVKVQDGCDNFCTYCITRLARGKSRSRPVEAVNSDVRAALVSGAKEVVLTGVHLGSWGYEFAQPQSIDLLIRQILAQTEIPRLHLSSIEPWDISPRFFELWQDPRLCRHLHLPLQSGCEATLRRMGRKITPSAFAELVTEARRMVPGMAITTDIITGFPDETQDEFEESSRFIADMHFANGHVFTFSPRPGTAAASLPGKVPHQVARQRNSQVRQIFREAAHHFRSLYVGQDLSVLWEKAVPLPDQHWRLSGLSDNYLRVHAASSVARQNEIARVHISGVDEDGLIGLP